MNKTVLITGIGGDVSQGVAAILKSSRPDLQLVGVDIHSRHGGRLFVQEYEEIPAASKPNYADELAAVIQRYKVDIVIPMSEPELAVLFPHVYKQLGAIWITPGEEVISAGLDKFSTSKAVEKLGLPAPWTVLSEKSMPLDYPCIFKSRRGSGSRAVYKIERPDDAKSFSHRFPDGIFQELLLPDDQEVTCAVYRTRGGRIESLQMLRQLAGGVTSWAKIIDDLDTSKMCARIAEGLDLRGSMNVQLRLTEEGPRVFEINPRFSSTAFMRHILGFSDVLWAIDEVEGRDVEFRVVPRNQVVVRTQGAEIVESDGNR